MSAAAAARAPSPAAGEKPRTAAEAEAPARRGAEREKGAHENEKTEKNETTEKAEKNEKTEKSDKHEKHEKEEARWRPVLNLPCELTVDLPLPNFKVADFLALRPGSILGTEWRLARDIPLHINGTLIGWAEFEGAGKRMAVRVTELA